MVHRITTRIHDVVSVHLDVNCNNDGSRCIMAVCPHCMKDDKIFFAEVCHNCNNHVTLSEQATFSTLYGFFTLLFFVMFLAIGVFIFKIIT